VSHNKFFRDSGSDDVEHPVFEAFEFTRRAKPVNALPRAVIKRTVFASHKLDHLVGIREYRPGQ
jgi:hypothetical protein